MTRGRLITIEGLDGAGKTTLAVRLQSALAGGGRHVRVLREPGGVRAAERVRELVHDPALEIGPRAEALLYAAARAQLVEEAVEPLLGQGLWVVLDRFVDSSMAYQGGGRELGLEAVGAINAFASGGLRPDCTLLLVIPPDVGQARIAARGQPPDRLELEQAGFFARVASAYEALAAQDPERIRRIDATQPPDQVLADSLRALADLV